MQSSFYKRYIQGEHSPVWNEIKALGEKAFLPDYFTDVHAVVREMMQRVAYNLKHTYNYLLSIGYVFHNPNEVILPPSPEVDSELHILEELVKPYGFLPLTIKEFYRVIGGIDFVHSYEFRGPKFAAYPLVINSLETINNSEYNLDPELMLSVRESYKNYREIKNVVLLIGPGDTYKLNVSGSHLGCYLEVLPISTVDSPIIDLTESWSFVDYLRLYCKHGAMWFWESPAEDATKKEPYKIPGFSYPSEIVSPEELYLAKIEKFFKPF